MQNSLPINQIKCFTMMMARENNIITYIKCTDDLSGCLFCSMTYFMGSDPFSSKVLINNSCPYRAAIWRGVFPNLSHTSMSAPVHKYILYTEWKKSWTLSMCLQIIFFHLYEKVVLIQLLLSLLTNGMRQVQILHLKSTYHKLL